MKAEQIFKQLKRENEERCKLCGKDFPLGMAGVIAYLFKLHNEFNGACDKCLAKVEQMKEIDKYVVRKVFMKQRKPAKTDLSMRIYIWKAKNPEKLQKLQKEVMVECL